MCIAIAGCNDTVQSNHATLAAAKQDIEKGWIPSVLPASATQIRESHDIDTNTGHGTFMFNIQDTAQFKSALTPLPPTEHLSGIPREQLEREGYNFYQHGDFYLAVDWIHGHGEFWLRYFR